MKTKKFSKTLLLFGALYVNLVVCIAGSIFGTYAWYQYSSRASVSYEGTAVGAQDSVEIGLYSDSPVNELSSQYGLELDTESMPGSYVYWAEGDLSSDAIQAYENSMGYSAIYVAPASSGRYSENDEFSLKKSPVYLETDEFKPAKKEYYSHIKFAIRVNGGNSVYLSNYKLSCDNPIGSAIRVCFENPNEQSSFILNPSSYENGATDVGGILDLNRDGFYDYEYKIEKLYGDFVYTFQGDPYIGPEDVVPVEEQTTFTANHKHNIIMWNFTPSQAHYYGKKDVVNTKPLSTLRTGEKLIRLDATIYLEGWDPACIDLDTEVSYNLNLEFATK